MSPLPKREDDTCEWMSTDFTICFAVPEWIGDIRSVAEEEITDMFEAIVEGDCAIVEYDVHGNTVTFTFELGPEDDPAIVETTAGLNDELNAVIAALKEIP